MTEIPSWFGQQEFYFVLATVWAFLISWVTVNFLRVKGTNLDIKKKMVSFKLWLKKRKEIKENKILGD